MGSLATDGGVSRVDDEASPAVGRSNRAVDAGDSRSGGGQAAGLVAASVAMLGGAAFAVNPASYGAARAALGAALLVAGLLAALRLFRGV